MKRTCFIGCLAVLLAACSNYEEKAQPYLQRAQELLQAGAYSEAKSQIDSIRTLYPKAVEARRAGIKLMQQIELKEQTRTLAYLDSAYRADEPHVHLLRQAQHTPYGGEGDVGRHVCTDASLA